MLRAVLLVTTCVLSCLAMDNDLLFEGRHSDMNPSIGSNEYGSRRECCNRPDYNGGFDCNGLGTTLINFTQNCDDEGKGDDGCIEKFVCDLLAECHRICSGGHEQLDACIRDTCSTISENSSLCDAISESFEGIVSCVLSKICAIVNEIIEISTKLSKLNEEELESLIIMANARINEYIISVDNSLPDDGSQIIQGIVCSIKSNMAVYSKKRLLEAIKKIQGLLEEGKACISKHLATEKNTLTSEIKCLEFDEKELLAHALAGEMEAVSRKFKKAFECAMDEFKVHFQCPTEECNEIDMGKLVELNW